MGEINRCLVSGYTVKVDIPKKKQTIFVKDLQSEENRDFVFELKVPQIEAEKKEDPVVQLSVTYDNVVRGGTDTLTNICASRESMESKLVNGIWNSTCNTIGCWPQMPWKRRTNWQRVESWKMHVRC